jgi:hypothetical protein
MAIEHLALVRKYGRADWALPDRRLVLHQIGRNISGLCGSERAPRIPQDVPVRLQIK